MTVDVHAAAEGPDTGQAEAREAIRLKMLEAGLKRTDGNDTFADGYANGLVEALHIIDRTVPVSPVAPQPTKEDHDASLSKLGTDQGAVTVEAGASTAAPGRTAEVVAVAPCDPAVPSVGEEAVGPVAPQLVEALREALNCRHNHTDDEAELRKLWRYVEHEGETWNRCNECGLLELWAAGSFIKADYAALAAVGPETPGTGGADDE